jgi:hypothetical protein
MILLHPPSFCEIFPDFCGGSLEFGSRARSAPVRSPLGGAGHGFERPIRRSMRVDTGFSWKTGLCAKFAAFGSVMIFVPGIATYCYQSIVEVRARQRRKVPVPDSVPLKNWVHDWPYDWISPLLPRPFPCSIFPEDFSLFNISPFS